MKYENKYIIKFSNWSKGFVLIMNHAWSKHEVSTAAFNSVLFFFGNFCVLETKEGLNHNIKWAAFLY